MMVLRTSSIAGLAWCAVSCASTPHNAVLDAYPAGVEGRTTVDYYDVTGRTYAELHAELRRLGPKNNGNSYVGETRSPLSWRWRAESNTGGSSCMMRDVRVRVDAQILLPRWTPPPDADTSVVAEWKRFIAALETHEAGHKDISARAGRELKDQLRALTGICSMVRMRADDIARRVLDAANLAQKRYDAETQHGLTQGTGFGPPRDVARVMRAERPPSHDDSSAAAVARLLVAPSALELKVGQSMSLTEMYRRFEVLGLTAQGDTLRTFTRTFVVEPNERLVRQGFGYLARRAGDVDLWIVASPPSRIDLGDSARVVRVPIHIR
jgi:predicted secreted Zn-dependent protease